MPSLIESITNANGNASIMDTENTNTLEMPNDTNFVSNNGAVATSIRLTSHDETALSNGKNYYLDSTTLRPHISPQYQTNGNEESSLIVNSIINDSDLDKPTNATENDICKPCSNYSKRNRNCIDLDFYDYLQKKSKYSTFTLWNLTASCNSPNLPFVNNSSINANISHINNENDTYACISNHRDDDLCNRSMKMKVLYDLRRKKPEYLSLDKVNELGAVIDVNFVNNTNGNGNSITNRSINGNSKLSLNENQLDLAIFKCLNKNLIESLFLNAKFEKSQTLIPSRITPKILTTTTTTKTTTDTTKKQETIENNNSHLSKINENEHENEANTINKSSKLITHEYKLHINSNNNDFLNVNTDKLNLENDTDELMAIKELLNELVDKIEMQKIELIQLGLPILITNSELEEKSSSLFGDEKYIQEANELTDLIANGGRNSRLASTNNDELEALFTCKSEELFENHSHTMNNCNGNENENEEALSLSLRAASMPIYNDDAIEISDDDRLIDVICDELQKSLPLSNLEEICIDQQQLEIKGIEKQKQEEKEKEERLNEIEIENAKLNKETNTLDKHGEINHEINPEYEAEAKEEEHHFEASKKSNIECDCNDNRDDDVNDEKKKNKYLTDLNNELVHDNDNKNNKNDCEDYEFNMNTNEKNEDNKRDDRLVMNNSSEEEIDRNTNNYKNNKDELKEKEKEGENEREKEINCVNEKIATQISNGCLMQTQDYHSSANCNQEKEQEKKELEKEKEQNNIHIVNNNQANSSPISSITNRNTEKTFSETSSSSSSNNSANNEIDEPAAMKKSREDTEIIGEEESQSGAHSYEIGLNANLNKQCTNQQQIHAKQEQNEEFSRSSDSYNELNTNNNNSNNKNNNEKNLKNLSEELANNTNINYCIKNSNNKNKINNSENYAENLQQANLKIEKSQKTTTTTSKTTQLDFKIKEILDESIAAIEANFDTSNKMSNKETATISKNNNNNNSTKHIKSNNNKINNNNNNNTHERNSRNASQVITLSDNKKKYIFSESEIAYVEDCDSDSECEISKKDAQYSLFGESGSNSKRQRDAAKTASPRNRGSSTGGVPFRYTFEQKPLDGDHCVKEALKRFDAFCKAKCQSAAKVEKPPQAPVPPPSAEKPPKDEIKPTDYTSFIKRRQNRINNLNMSSGNAQKMLQRSESCDNHPNARAEFTRQKSESPGLANLKVPMPNRAASSFAKRFLESMGRTDEPDEFDIEEQLSENSAEFTAEKEPIKADKDEKEDKSEADKIEKPVVVNEPVEKQSEKMPEMPIKPIVEINTKPSEKSEEIDVKPSEKLSEEQVAKPIEKAVNAENEKIEHEANKKEIDKVDKMVNKIVEKLEKEKVAATKDTNELKKTIEEPQPKSPKSPTNIKPTIEQQQQQQQQQPSSPRRTLMEERKLLKSPTKDPLRNSTEKPSAFKTDYQHLSTKEIIKFLNSNTQQQQQQQQTSPRKEPTSPTKPQQKPSLTDSPAKKDESKKPEQQLTRPTDLNTRSRASSNASSSDNSTNSIKNKNVNIIKLELINSKLNNNSGSSVSHRSSNASSENCGVFSDSENSPAPLSPSSWRKKLRSFSNNAHKSNSIDNDRVMNISSTKSSPTCSEKPLPTSDKSPTKTARSKSVSDSNTEIKPRYIPIEIKKSTRSLNSEPVASPTPPTDRKSSTSSNEASETRSEKIERDFSIIKQHPVETKTTTTPKSGGSEVTPPTSFNAYLESNSIDSTSNAPSKSSSGDNFVTSTNSYNMDSDTERRLRDIYYSRQDFDQPSRRAVSEEPDPLVEKACNNFMYKFMEFKRQRQMSNPGSTLTPSDSGAYLSNPYQSCAASISATTENPYKHSLSTPSCDFNTYRRNVYATSDDGYAPTTPTTLSTNESERPYVSSIRKRRTLLSDESNTQGNRLYGATGSASAYEMTTPYNRLLHSSSTPYTSINEPKYSSPYYTSPYSSYNTTTDNKYGSNYAARPLSMVNEEFNSRYNFAQDYLGANYTTDTKLNDGQHFDSRSFNLSADVTPDATLKKSTEKKLSDIKDNAKDKDKNSSVVNRSKSVGLKKETVASTKNNLISKPMTQSAVAQNGSNGASSVFNRLAQNASKLKSLQQTVSSHSTMNQPITITSELPDTKTSRKMTQQNSSEDEGCKNGTGTTRPTYLRLKSNESTKDKLRKETVVKKSVPSQSKGSTEIPVKVETVIPITIETKDNRRPSNGSVKSSNSPMSPPATLKKKPTQITTNYAFGSTLNNSRTNSMKNLSTINRSNAAAPIGESTFSRMSPEKQVYKSSTSDLLNFGLSLPTNNFDDVDIGIDTETCVNTKLNQQQSRNGLNVFERLYRGSTPTASTTSTSAVSASNPQQIMNTLLFPPQSDSNGNGPKQTLKKNMSISTASLSSSTGSNNTNSTQSGQQVSGAKPLSEDNRSTSKGSLNTAAKASVFDRLSGTRGSLKKSSLNLNQDNFGKAYVNLSSASTNSLSSSRPEFHNNSSDDNQEVSSSVSSRKSTGPTANAFNRQNSLRSNKV